MSDPQKQNNEYLRVGGQAIIEGVMMRTPDAFSVAVRAPNGELIVQTEPMQKTWIGKQTWLMKPFLRGTFMLLDALTLGSKALKFSSHIQLDEKYLPDEEKEQEANKTDKKKESEKTIRNIAIGATVVISLAFGFFVFSFVPNLVAEQARLLGITNGTAINYITETIKVIFVIGYLWGISYLPDIQRVFQYHGAEHKAINTYEAGEELTIDNCRAQTRLHMRCGTSFAIIVLIVSFLFFPLVPRYPIPDLPMIGNVVVRVLVELMILPIVAGVAFEILRFAGMHGDKNWARNLFAPGLWTQKITTKEPDNSQIEVALESLKSCLAYQGETAEKSEPEAPKELEETATVLP